jgi:hypothetical protein
MSWVVVGVAGTTAAVGAVTAAQQRKAQQQANQKNAEMAAAQMEYSPWTGIKPQSAEQQAVTASPMAGAIQGGLSGAMFGTSLKKGMAENDKLAADAAAAKKAEEEAAQKQQLASWNPNRA